MVTFLSLFDFWHSSAQPSFLPFFSRFWRSFPCAYTPTAPNLNPIFHITSRKSYSAAGQEAVRRTAPARRNGETFLSSLCFYPPLSPFSTSSPCRSKTISEHIAPRFSRSALRARPAAMSSRLFDPRGRRNNAYTTAVAVFPQFPLFSSFVVLAPLLLHAFRHARNPLGERPPSKLLAN